jgi:hypothetical protein
MPTTLIEECYRRAADAKRLAETASMPTNKTNFLGMEQRWLLAARSLTSGRSFGGQLARREKAMAQETMHVNEPKSPSAPRRRRPTKFTLERIQQIKSLVSQGKSREEIAGLIGVTVGSLQVTCSRLGIILRRAGAESNLQEQGGPYNGTGEFNRSGETSVHFTIEHLDQFLQSGRKEVATARPDENSRQQSSSANFALSLRYKGQERTSPLPLSASAVGQLAIEAALRNMTVGEFVGALMKATLEKGLCQQVLEAS